MVIQSSVSVITAAEAVTADRAGAADRIADPGEMSAPGSWLAQIISAIIQTLRRRYHIIGHGEQAGDTWVAQTVFDEAAALLACHKAAFAKAAEMVRGVRLAKAGRGDDFSDRQRPGTQRLEDRQARVIGKPPEQLGLQGEGAVSDEQHGQVSRHITER